MLVVAVALVGVQVVVELRDRAAVAALAQVPGVVRPVDEDVRILWTVEPGTQWVVWSGPTGGAHVGLQRTSDGSQALIAVDELTGERRWTTPLPDAHADHAQEGFSPVGGCAAEPEDSGRIVCLVTDAYLAFRQTENVLVPSEVSRIVVADRTDGSIVAEHEVPGAVAFAVLPGTVAVAVPLRRRARRDGVGPPDRPGAVAVRRAGRRPPNPTTAASSTAPPSCSAPATASPW